ADMVHHLCGVIVVVHADEGSGGGRFLQTVDAVDNAGVLGAGAQIEAAQKPHGGHGFGGIGTDVAVAAAVGRHDRVEELGSPGERDRKSTRLNSSHLVISYAVFCLKKKK